METTIARSCYDDSFLPTSSKLRGQTSSTLGLINQILAKPRSTLAADAICVRPGSSTIIRPSPKPSNQSRLIPHYDSDGSGSLGLKRPILGVKKLKQSTGNNQNTTSQAKILNKENNLQDVKNSPKHNNNDFRRPESPRLSRLNCRPTITSHIGASRDSRPSKPGPLGAGVMESRPSEGQRSIGPRLRSKSSSRVLDAGTDSGTSLNLGVFGGGRSSNSNGKSAVELLEASKSLYVKSVQVRERKQAPSFSGVLQVTSHNTDPKMMVSMTKDGVPTGQSIRDSDAGAMSDDGIIEGCHSQKPMSLSFTPTPMLVHQNALQPKDLQASSSGELLDQTASPSSSSSSSHENLLVETPSTSDDILEKVSLPHSIPITSSRPSRPGPAVAPKPRSRVHNKQITGGIPGSNRHSTYQPSLPFPIEAEALHTSAKKLSLVSDTSTTSDEEPWKRDGHHAKKPRHQCLPPPSPNPDLSCPDGVNNRAYTCRTNSSRPHVLSGAPPLRPILSKKRFQSYSLDEEADDCPFDRDVGVRGISGKSGQCEEEKGLPHGNSDTHQKLSRDNRTGSHVDVDTCSSKPESHPTETSGDEICGFPVSAYRPSTQRPSFHSAVQASAFREGRHPEIKSTRSWGSKENVLTTAPFKGGQELLTSPLKGDSLESSPGRGVGVQRSKSDASHKAGASGEFATLLQQKHSPDLDRFFDSMGIDQSVLLSASERVEWEILGGAGPGGPTEGHSRGGPTGAAKAWGDSGSSLDSFPRTGSDNIRSTGSDFGDDEDGEGGAVGRVGGRGHPLMGRNSRDVSVIERNARVIKWLCNVSKAKQRTVTE